ncbi:MAG: ATP-binding cassette domain-containing protein [Alphaproteobacteria bacterium]
MSEVRSLSRRFGGLAAVDRLSFSVDEGEIRGLIGPNGAGKTTTFNVISGFYRPTAGEVIYRGETISGLKTSDIARRGLVRTFQSTTLFHEFSVLDNVLVGCHLHGPVGFVGAILGTSRAIEDAARAVTSANLARLAGKSETDGGAEDVGLARWSRERPSAFSDERKLAGATLLVAHTRSGRDGDRN